MLSIKNILTAVFVFGIFALHPSLNKGESPITHLHYFVYGNDFNFSYNENINKEKVLIKWACEESTANCNDLIIYQNGKKINEIPFEQGNQKLIVYYNSKIVGAVNQNKTSKTQAHQYNIALKADANMLTFIAEITGPAASKISKSISITDAILAKQ
jgi:hypothetical protein